MRRMTCIPPLIGMAGDALLVIGMFPAVIGLSLPVRTVRIYSKTSFWDHFGSAFSELNLQRARPSYRKDGKGASASSHSELVSPFGELAGSAIGPPSLRRSAPAMSLQDHWWISPLRQ